jgi:molecular chaperone GrpE
VILKQQDKREQTDVHVNTQPVAEPSLAAAETPAQEPLPGSEVQPLMEQIAKLQAEKDSLFNSLVARQADFENYRKRIERERKEDNYRATAALIGSMLPVLDAFERALAAHDDPAYEEYRGGFELIYRQLRDALAGYGLKPIEAQGKPFDPYYHQAIERVETSEHEDGMVIEELQRGYKFRDKILRPTLVRVAVKPAREQPIGETGVNNLKHDSHQQARLLRGARRGAERLVGGD